MTAVVGGADGAGERLVRRWKRHGEKPGLARIEFLLDGLGRPERAFPAVHVAGTNGKGSTAAMIAAVLRAAGLKVGVFTSPHLVRYNERIAVDGRPVSDEELAPLLDRIAAGAEAAAADPAVGHPTEFEATTAAALAHFAAAQVDVAVVEAGLGGRLDSTNVVRPVVTVVTPIGLDHTAVLGATVEEIAADKAGVLRRDTPVVLARQPAGARAVLRRRAAAAGVPVREAGLHFDTAVVNMDLTGTTIDLDFSPWPGFDFGAEGSAPSRAEAGRLGRVWLPLVGAHQADNAGVAVAAAASALASELGAKAAGASLASSVRKGLAAVGWPGRFERIDVEPDTFVDGAHNGEAARALAATLRAVAEGRPVVLVLGLLEEKPVEAMLTALLPGAVAAVFTKPTEGRTPGADPRHLRAAALRLAPPEGGLGSRWPRGLEVEPDPVRAVARARRIAGRDGLVVVAGSLYLVGEVKAAAERTV